jgi:hypothetical protein
VILLSDQCSASFEADCVETCNDPFYLEGHPVLYERDLAEELDVFLVLAQPPLLKDPFEGRLIECCELTPFGGDDCCLPRIVTCQCVVAKMA